MHWTWLEQNIFARFNRYPLSTTPRERTLMLLTIRVALLGGLCFPVSLILFAISALVDWQPPALAGAAFFIGSMCLLTLAMTLLACVIIAYGD